MVTLYLYIKGSARCSRLGGTFIAQEADFAFRFPPSRSNLYLRRVFGWSKQDARLGSVCVSVAHGGGGKAASPGVAMVMIGFPSQLHLHPSVPSPLP